MAARSILVLGAGELGLAILRSLCGHPSRAQSEIAVLLRASTTKTTESSKRKSLDELQDLGVELVAGDVLHDTVEQLAATFGKFSTVISAQGMVLPQGSQLKLSHAALLSGIKRYFPWQFGVDYDAIGRNSSQDLFTEQLDVRDVLRNQCAMEWVIVSTGLFTSFIFELAFGIVNAARDVVTALGGWENRVTATSPDDIGKLTAEIALSCPQTNGVVFVAGETVR